MQLFFFLVFLFVSFLSFFLPGSLLLSLLKVGLTKTEVFFFRWVIGIAVFLFGTYVLSWIHGDYLYGLILLASVVWFIRSEGYRKVSIDVEKISLYLILLGTVAFVSVTMLSGIKVAGGLQYVGIGNADGIVHIAHIKDQITNFPPTHPGLAGVPLRGYHYFYDFLLSKFAKYYHFSVDDLYFRFFPFLISFLYGLAFYVFISRVIKNVVVARLTVFLAFFGQSFSFIFTLLHISPDPMSGGGLIQALQLPFDPSVIVSLTFLLGAFALIPKIHESWKHAVIVGLLIGMTSQMKVYAGITACITIGVYLVYYFLKNNRKKIGPVLLAVGLAAFGTMITFFPNNLGAGKLIFAPFRIYSHYMEQPIFDPLHWEVRRQVFSAHHNIARIIILYAEALAIFWGINLGWRLLLLFKVRALFTKKFWENEYAFLLTVAIVISFTIGSLFIQSISVFDSIQFLWVGYALLTVPLGLIIPVLFQKKFALWTTVVIIILTALPAIWAIEDITVFHPQRVVIPNKTVAFYQKVTRIVPVNSFVIILPSNGEGVEKYVWSTTPITEALSSRAAYYEGEIINYNLAIADMRKKHVLALYDAIVRCNRPKIAREVGIIGSKYIIGDKDYSCLSMPFARLTALAAPLRLYVVQ